LSGNAAGAVEELDRIILLILYLKQKLDSRNRLTNFFIPQAVKNSEKGDIGLPSMLMLGVSASYDLLHDAGFLRKVRCIPIALTSRLPPEFSTSFHWDFEFRKRYAD
jgi:hypothetical protein